MGKNYIKLQNQGSISQNLMLLNEMNDSSGYADDYGYFTKRAVAELAIKSAVITSAGKLGDDILSLVHDGDIDESRNSVLQNAKARMQILRVLGLVAADYDAEIYSITDLGMRVLQRVFPMSSSEIPDYRLLRESFMGISSESEVYDYNCEFGFNCFLGYEICYALAKLDYKISVQDMPCVTTYGVHDIDLFVKTVKEYRKKHQSIPVTHEHYPKTQQGAPLRQASNITRTINQILRICNIIQRKSVSENGQKFYVCTTQGREYVDEIAARWRNLRFVLPCKFRRETLLEQKKKCYLGYNNILDRGGFEVEAESGVDGVTVFSPYQMIPETNANWFLSRDLRKPPKDKETQVNVINSQISAPALRVKPNYRTYEEYEEYIHTHSSKNRLISEIVSAKEHGVDRMAKETELLLRHKGSDKSMFYPFVHSLLGAIGLDCKGEVGRYDALVDYRGRIIPVEIKSYTETPAYNMKGVRQALENKITSYKDKEDLAYASLLIGYDQPKSTKEIQEFIDAARDEWSAKIVVMDMSTLVGMCMRVIWDRQQIEFGELLTSSGIMEA